MTSILSFSTGLTASLVLVLAALSQDSPTIAARQEPGAVALGLNPMVGATTPASYALASTRDVEIDLSGTANTPAKLGNYHLDLIRDDGYKVGYGLDVSVDARLPDGQRWHRYPRWIAVPTNWGYTIKVTHNGSTWYVPRETVNSFPYWVYQFNPYYLAW